MFSDVTSVGGKVVFVIKSYLNLSIKIHTVRILPKYTEIYDKTDSYIHTGL